ncbi:MAG: hypothetical protein Q7T85_02900 [Nitrosomonas sp.]|nr:hypothetical protein [Nitrosomonas sp.]
MSIFNSTVVQHKRILNFLHTCIFSTLTVRKKLDVIHIAAWVMEVREEFHSVEFYVLKVGAVAPAPADKADGIHRQETDKTEHSMEGTL